MFKDKTTKNYLIISIIFVLLTIIPYIIGLLGTPQNMIFSGVLDSSVDQMTYYEKINNGKYFNSLEFLVRSNSQTEDISGGYLFTLYSLFGVIFSFLPTIWIYQILRILSIIVLLVCLYKFLKEFVNQKELITSAIIMLFMTSITNLLPLYFHVLKLPVTLISYINKDLFIFTSALYRPHFTLSIALIMLSLITVNKYDTNKIKYSIINGLILFLIATIHPQVAVFTGLIEGIYLLTEIKKRSYKIKDLLPISLWGLIPLPYLIYCLYIFSSYYSLIVWKSNNVHPLELPSIIFVYVPTLLFWCYLFIKNKNFIKENKLLFLHSFLLCLIVFLPQNMQVKLTEGATIGTFLVFGKYLSEKQFFKNKIRLIIISLITVLCYIPLLFGSTMIVKNEEKICYNLVYFPDYYQELSQEIDNLNYPTIVFANLYTSNYVLANTKQIVPLSFHDECDKYEDYEKLYLNAISTKDFSFLNDIDVDYYIYDKYVAGLNDTIEVESNLPYEKYKETENYIIYKIGVINNE